MRRPAIFLLVAAACGPEPPPTQHDTATSAGSTGAVTSSTGATPTTGATTSDGSGAEPSTGALPGTSTTSTTGSSSGGESSTGEGGTTGELAPCCLAPDEPTSSVQATTPVGVRALPWATLSVSGGECGGSIFMDLFTDSSAIGVEWPELNGVDHLRISASSYMDMWPNGFMGAGPVWVEASFDGQSAMIEGEITILEFVDDPEGGWCDPDRVPIESDAHASFTIALKADGWDVAGQVLANYCPALNQICP
jgi:hypothetical protein